jgi:hypothetical protein
MQPLRCDERSTLVLRTRGRRNDDDQCLNARTKNNKTLIFLSVQGNREQQNKYE